MTDTVDNIAIALDALETNALQYAPWHSEGVKPMVTFSIAYNDDAIYLKYYVAEETVKAQYDRINDPVYEDSCVEFFVAFDDDANYYNLEFNCTGTGRVQYGAAKTGRVFIPASLIKKIQHQTYLQSNSKGFKWELTLCIPRDVFMYHPGLQFKDTTARVNFYKCGDGLPQPHFLCWSNIEAVQPEFHLSKFFKEVTFS